MAMDSPTDPHEDTAEAFLASHSRQQKTNTLRQSRTAGGERGEGKSNRDRNGKEKQNREVLVSKKLSWLLRHAAEKEGLVLGRGGYVGVGDVLQNRNIRSLKTSFAEIKDIVASNEKQRFSLIHVSAFNKDNPASEIPATAAETGNSTIDAVDKDEDPKNWLIRANQGHSIAVETADLLTAITLDDPSSLPAMVVHGTRHGAWPLILESGGLKRMGRNHVHFATGVPEQLAEKFRQTSTDSNNSDTDEASTSVAAEPLDPNQADQPQILSGMRNSSTLLIYINLRLALGSGLKFFKSENGVVLSEGDEKSGVVGVEYFEKVVEKGGRVLVVDGKVVAEADEAMLRQARASGGGRGGRGRGRGGGRGGRGGGRGEKREDKSQEANNNASTSVGTTGRGGMANGEAAKGPHGVVGAQ